MSEIRRLSVILFTDMVGYSRKISQNEAAALKLLKEHNRILDASIASHGGTLIKTAGDSYMVDFPSVLGAVSSAIDIQHALASYNRTASEQIDLRIGIHAGDVVHRDGDVFGDGVNIASRVMSVADGEQIFISGDVLSIAYGKMDLKVKDLGPRELKNITRPVHIYEVLWDPARQGEASVVGGPALRRKESSWSRPVVAVGALLVLAAAYFVLQPSLSGTGAPGKLRLAVVDFLDDTGDERLERLQIGRILGDAIVQKLSEDGRVQVLSPLRVQKAMRDLSITTRAVHDDPEAVGTIAEEVDGRVIVRGSLRRNLDDTFILSAGLIDLGKDDERLDNVVLNIPAAEAIHPEFVDSLCNRFQKRINAAFDLGPTRVESVVSVGTLTTESLDAYAHFLQGHELYASGDIDSGIDELLKAIEIDPDFAMAYSMVGCAYSFAKQDSLSRVYEKKAREYKDRFTGYSKESLIFKGNLGWFENNFESCEKNYRLIIDLYPDDHTGYNYHGLFLHYLKNDYNGAIARYREAIQRNPKWFPTYRDLAYAIQQTEGTDAAVTILQHYRRSFPNAPGAEFARETIAQLRGA